MDSSNNCDRGLMSLQTKPAVKLQVTSPQQQISLNRDVDLLVPLGSQFRSVMDERPGPMVG